MTENNKRYREKKRKKVDDIGGIERKGYSDKRKIKSGRKKMEKKRRKESNLERKNAREKVIGRGRESKWY